MSKNVITKTKKAPMEGKVRKGFKTYVGIILCLTMLCIDDIPPKLRIKEQ